LSPQAGVCFTALTHAQRGDLFLATLGTTLSMNELIEITVVSSNRQLTLGLEGLVAGREARQVANSPNRLRIVH
jgi:hypothetical protein